MYRYVVVVLAIAAGSVGATAHGQVELKHKFPPGKQYTTRVETKVDQTLNLAGMDVKTAVENEITSKHTIGSVDADGNLPITVKHEKLNFHLAAPGGVELSYDSTNPTTNTGGIPQLEAVVELLKTSTKGPMTYLLDSKRKVTQVTGLQELFEGLSTEAKAFAKGQFEFDRVKLEFEQQFGVLPDKPVKKGDTWTREEQASLGAGQTMTFSKEYAYEGTVEKDGKTLDKITAKIKDVEFEQEAGAGPAQITESELKADSSEQTVLFDREAGRIVESKADIKIKGSLTLNVNGQDYPGKLDLRMQIGIHVD